MTPEAFSSIIYNNFLFDIPKVLDLCVLYKENPILSKIIQNLFSTQKNYYQDFKLCIRDIIKAMESSKRKLRNIFELDSVYNFNDNFSNKISTLNDRTQSSLKDIFEIIYYLTDFVITLNDLISFETKICDYLFEEKFEININELMESTLFGIEDILKQMKSEGHNELAVLVKTKLKTLKHEIARLFNNMFLNCSVNPMISNLETSNESEHHQHIEKFIKICCEVLEYKRFLCYFEEAFNFSEQVDLVFQLANKYM